jgi:hypothetical protein
MSEEAAPVLLAGGRHRGRPSWGGYRSRVEMGGGHSGSDEPILS